MTSPRSADRPPVRCHKFKVSGDAKFSFTMRSPFLDVLSTLASLMSSSAALPLMPFKPKLASRPLMRTRPVRASPVAEVGEMFSAGASTATSKGPSADPPLARTASFSICNWLLWGSMASLGMATLASTLVARAAGSVMSPWKTTSRPAISSDDFCPLKARLPRMARLLASAPGSLPSRRRSSFWAA
ncbi:hypothetical protein D3C73_1138160 [compost metagenome]